MLIIENEPKILLRELACRQVDWEEFYFQREKMDLYRPAEKSFISYGLITVTQSFPSYEHALEAFCMHPGANHVAVPTRRIGNKWRKNGLDTVNKYLQDIVEQAAKTPTLGDQVELHFGPSDTDILLGLRQVAGKVLVTAFNFNREYVSDPAFRVGEFMSHSHHAAAVVEYHYVMHAMQPSR